MAWIYKITSPIGKVYIGSTIDFEKRFRCYKKLTCKAQPKIYCSLVKYGVDKHAFEVITECDDEVRYLIEQDYAIFFKAVGDKGLNCHLPTDQKPKNKPRNRKYGQTQKVITITRNNFKDEKLYQLSENQKGLIFMLSEKFGILPDEILRESLQLYFYNKIDKASYLNTFLNKIQA